MTGEQDRESQPQQPAPDAGEQGYGESGFSDQEGRGYGDAPAGYDPSAPQRAPQGGGPADLGFGEGGQSGQGVPGNSVSGTGAEDLRQAATNQLGGLFGQDDATDAEAQSEQDRAQSSRDAGSAGGGPL
jgi:hypothetical protein